jgi:hypothetical protein
VPSTTSTSDPSAERTYSKSFFNGLGSDFDLFFVDSKNCFSERFTVVPLMLLGEQHGQKKD